MSHCQRKESSGGLVNKVIDGGYCIGCGACAYVNADQYRIKEDVYGRYQAEEYSNSRNEPSMIEKICPFTGEGPDETTIGKELFDDLPFDKRLGYYRGLYAGGADSTLREKTTSGGIITWTLLQLLRNGEIDGVIHVKKNPPGDKVLFSYGLSKTEEEIIAGAKSRYYPVEISAILELLSQIEGDFVFVGLPCFVKTIRRLCKEDQRIGAKIKYCIGLVCGHLKSKGFAENFAFQMGVKYDEISEIDFRVKCPEKTAADYAVRVRGRNIEKTCNTRDLFGSNWGLNLFRYSACNYCDDVFSETADMAVGDAWLPEYVKDSRGTSIVVVRNQKLNVMIDHAIQQGELEMDTMDADRVADSQAGGLRDRREGLRYRLYLKQKDGLWSPPKRYEPSQKGLSRSRKGIYRSRIELEYMSHKVWLDCKKTNTEDAFKEKMSGGVLKLHDYYSPMWRRILKKSKRFVFGLLGH